MGGFGLKILQIILDIKGQIDNSLCEIIKERYMECKILKRASFGETAIDFWEIPNNLEGFGFTREQIGQALEYEHPKDAIKNIHSRYQDRLDKHSVSLKLSGTDGKLYNTFVYNHRGVYEICRWSRQPKADAFIDWVWDRIEELRNHSQSEWLFPDLAKPSIIEGKIGHLYQLIDSMNNANSLSDEEKRDYIQQYHQRFGFRVAQKSLI